MPLPGNVNYGTVVGRIIDAGGTPWAGTVKFTPHYSKLANATAGPPVTITPKPVQVDAGPTGQIGPVNLIATDDLDNTPVNWTYTVSFTPSGSSGPVDSFDIAVPLASYDPAYVPANWATSPAVDLTIVSPVGSSGGAQIIRGPSGDGLPSTAGVTSGWVATVDQSLAFDPKVKWAPAPTGGGGGPALTDYSQIAALNNYPTAFPPAGHSHTADGISDATAIGKALIRAADVTAGRTAIGAGTSNLALVASGGSAGTAATAARSDHAHVASAITFTPTGTISSTNVQAAIAEVASEAGTGGGGSSLPKMVFWQNASDASRRTDLPADAWLFIKDDNGSGVPPSWQQSTDEFLSRT